MVSASLPLRETGATPRAPRISRNGRRAALRAARDLAWKREESAESLSSLVKILELKGCIAQADMNKPVVQREVVAEKEPLVVMSLNMQYYASYPENAQAGKQKLLEALGGPCPPDVICVQEGLSGTDVLHEVGFDLVACTGARGVAQTVREMVYGDNMALKGCSEDCHDQLLCNQVYLRRGSKWVVEDSGAEQISSELSLSGIGDRVCAPLATRSMLWVKMRHTRSARTAPSVTVMCTHISGGRFEDQYFAQSLANERRRQLERCDEFFRQHVKQHLDDVGILVGDFNATEEYRLDGPMHGYFKGAIAGSPGVLADAESAGLHTEADLEEQFKAYMVSPFRALRETGWTFAYGEEAGVTSAFGHLIDHMALSRPLNIARVEVIPLTNQKLGGKEPDTDLVITDHNAVKVALTL